MANDPNPYILIFPQVTVGIGHDFAVGVMLADAAVTVVGQTPETVMLETKGADDVTLSDGANDFWDIARALFPVVTLCSTYNLFRLNPLNNKHEFISGGILTNKTGVGGNVSVPARQATFSWRTAHGGYTKIVTLEGSFDRLDQVPLLSTGLPAVNALNEYMLSDECIVLGRDRGWPVGALNASFTPNKAIAKRRNRP